MSSSSASQVASATILQDNETSPSGADVQNLLRANNACQLVLKKLQYIELLQTQVKQLEANQRHVSPSRFQISNRIMQKVYYDHKGQIGFEWQRSSPCFDEPEWIKGQGDQRQLRSSLLVTKLELYLEKNKDIAFIVYRDFHPAPPDMADSGTAHRRAKSSGAGRPKPLSETIQPVAQVLTEAIEALPSS
ncbi:uncharacterized protein A1O5_06039 [Cladophialophora psammophila CBS 110553]|uniref:Uncharacterized protein n=1 Tax=Cladophialophora psammophila CBS 110553 TaxID=1182543 RepID=W9X290_9EURO|nr:uncharacterized protein A1O5_06039 [Cladophialophora psammophila CBS 110553]EXJ71046.1 hypothetical protein A1O5_06039 [Cladophialophora psammophila CBS 110553]